MTEILHVEFIERSYPIYIGQDLGDVFTEVRNRLRKDGRRVAVIADQAVARLYPELLEHIVAVGEKPLLLPGNEQTKS
ncbi:MAG: 3-dehydroquinate synthase, partial [Limisphaerales bacterium]